MWVGSKNCKISIGRQNWCCGATLRLRRLLVRDIDATGIELTACADSNSQKVCSYTKVDATINPLNFN